MKRRPTISFSVTPEQLKEIKIYAEIKGFDKPSILARKSLFSYMNRNPLKKKTWHAYINGERLKD